jgi:hypothetical protein
VGVGRREARRESDRLRPVVLSRFRDEEVAAHRSQAGENVQQRNRQQLAEPDVHRSPRRGDRFSEAVPRTPIVMPQVHMRHLVA